MGILNWYQKKKKVKEAKCKCNVFPDKYLILKNVKRHVTGIVKVVYVSVYYGDNGRVEGKIGYVYMHDFTNLGRHYYTHKNYELDFNPQVEHQVFDSFESAAKYLLADMLAETKKQLILEQMKKEKETHKIVEEPKAKKSKTRMLEF